ncbi:tripartite motif-containing protein 3-like [Patiria miniata]|uniref:Uncharacterized protein n=1 Tax=Patiria miniata TaxID=46514 RepID=A0A913ZMR4_PATMI|nr:tripartite motif-containing protein 3-like [Patiria miniata]
MAEAAAKTLLDNISQRHLECPVCCCGFKDPKILDCFHSFCLNCLEEMMSKQKSETEKITCPVCRKETQVRGGSLQHLSNSFFISSLVDEFNQQKQELGEASGTSERCKECEKGLEALWRCLDCKVNICKKCQDAHTRPKHTNDHQLIPMQDVRKSRVLAMEFTEKRAPKCRKHSDHAICFYCEKCNTLICSMCAAGDHRSADHKYAAIEDVVKSFRKSVNDKLQKFKKSKEQLSSNEVSIKCAQNRLRKNLAHAHSDISAKAKAEISKIRIKAKLLAEKVEKIGQERDSEYEKALIHNRGQMERADQIVTAVNDLMGQCDDFELLKLKREVMLNLEFQKEPECEPAKVDMAFIGVKCQDVVSNKDLGTILLKENWCLKGKFGKQGTGDGQFAHAAGIACFANGDVVVTDIAQTRLSLFTASGRFKTSVDQGTKSNQLKNPWRVGVNSDNHLFVTDEDKVKVFDKELQFVRDFTPSVYDAVVLPESDLSGIAVDKQRVAVADRGRRVLKVLKFNGSLIASAPNNVVDNNLAMSNKERLIFTNYEEKRLLCVDYKGNESFSVMTLMNGKPAKPTCVLCDDDGSIYVAVHSGKVGNSEVHRYDSNGAFEATVAQGLYNPSGMTFTPAGDVIVADTHSVKIFQRM